MTKNEMKHFMRIARELGYGDEVVNRIKNAKTEFEATQILTSARKKLCEEALRR